jgi:hypothetical protein
MLEPVRRRFQHKQLRRPGYVCTKILTEPEPVAGLGVKTIRYFVPGDGASFDAPTIRSNAARALPGDGPAIGRCTPTAAPCAALSRQHESPVRPCVPI